MSELVSRRDFVLAAGVAAAGLTLPDGIAPVQAAPPSQAPGRTAVFIRDVKQARLFDLSHLWDETSPIASVNPSFEMSLDATHAGTIGSFDGHLSFTSEIMKWSGQHGAPNLDALGHIGHDGLLFGGVNAFDATSDPRGIGRNDALGNPGAHLDIAHYPPDLLVNRGVLLDVASFVNGDLTPLPAPPAGFEITAQHLADTAAAQRVTLEPGDTVLIRTGWGQYFGGTPAQKALYAGGSSPGPGVNGAQFLVDAGARVVGSDTLTFERRPPLAFPPDVPSFQIFPVHQLLIPGAGTFIIENFFLEELAAARVYAFLLVVPPLKMRGGTGSALRAFALAPDASAA